MSNPLSWPLPILPPGVQIRGDRFRASAASMVRGKMQTIHLGTFDTVREAAQAIVEHKTPEAAEAPDPVTIVMEREQEAVRACRMYARTKARLHRLSRNDRRYQVVASKLGDSMRWAVVCLRCWGGHRDSPNRRSLPLLVDGRVYWVDAAGELNEGNGRIKGVKRPTAAPPEGSGKRVYRAVEAGRRIEPKESFL